ncbi:AGAP012776-PA [Anopheles gambiae str. PEST]|uniref:AGAP012776-PA n=2 Tax=gambiae species complex TaxID=44542 RepID=A0NAK4_ANOGA|nr:AGAP012776-PA [Anopheles gambiae str. PEST]
MFVAHFIIWKVVPPRLDRIYRTQFDEIE